LPSGHKRSIELTNRYAKLARVGIPTKMDTLIGEADMMGSKHIMNGSDKLIGKVDLMKVSESQRVDNNLDKDKSTLKNQDRMITHNVVANQDYL
jgi:hypothetical protein